jgi:hypothetical protein
MTDNSRSVERVNEEYSPYNEGINVNSGWNPLNNDVDDIPMG